jgi:hypothetical protein
MFWVLLEAAALDRIALKQGDEFQRAQKITE